MKKLERHREIANYAETLILHPRLLFLTWKDSEKIFLNYPDWKLYWAES